MLFRSGVDMSLGALDAAAAVFPRAHARKVRDEEIVVHDPSPGLGIGREFVRGSLGQDDLEAGGNHLGVVDGLGRYDDLGLGLSAPRLGTVGLRLDNVKLRFVVRNGLADQLRGQNDPLSAGSGDANFKPLRRHIPSTPSPCR